MAHLKSAPVSELTPPAGTLRRHSILVRVTHWVTTMCFVALLVSGVEILLSHPRFYWGEAGNVHTPSLFVLPFPASRSSVPTGYGYVLEDQNGWSRYLHFEAAWLVVAAGLLYAGYGLLTGHFRKTFLPPSAQFSWRFLSVEIANHLRLTIASETEGNYYNLLQGLSYLLVVFVLFPAIIWTGLAMSPAVVSAFPIIVTIMGGQQSARTIHFFLTIVLSAFVLVHVMMISLSGFRARMRSMITGAPKPQPERE